MTIPFPNRLPVTAVILVLLGMLVAFTPWYIFPVCEAKGTSDNSMASMHKDSGSHMKCWYTAEADTVAGILVLLTGLALIALPGRVLRKTAGILGIVFGIIVILIPAAIIGVCNTPDAPCRIGTLPALTLLGAFTGIVGIWLVLSKNKDSTVSP